MEDLILYDKDKQIEYIGDFAADLFVVYMSEYRKFNKEMIIDYLINVYGCKRKIIDNDDKFNSILDRHCKQEVNIFDEYYKQDDYRKYEQSNRDYFNNKVKNKYIGFHLDNFGEKCYISGFLEPYAVHHIFPLQYGGTNQLENLIYISGTMHKILHKNPKEESYTYCQVAVDHLILATRGYQWIDMHQAVKESGGDLKKATMIYLEKVEDRMNNFYEKYFK